MSIPINPEQWEIVGRQLAPLLRYVRRLFNRMEKIGVPNDDKVFVATRKAIDALHELTVRVHYAKCPRGVGKPAEGKLIPLDEVDRLTAEMSERMKENAENQSRKLVD
jgi:hypothetical protein